MAEVARKKRRTASKATARAIVGVSLEVINKKRTEKPEVRRGSGQLAGWVLSNGCEGLDTGQKVSAFWVQQAGGAGCWQLV